MFDIVYNYINSYLKYPFSSNFMLNNIDEDSQIILTRNNTTIYKKKLEFIEFLENKNNHNLVEDADIISINYRKLSDNKIEIYLLTKQKHYYENDEIKEIVVSDHIIIKINDNKINYIHHNWKPLKL